MHTLLQKYWNNLRASYWFLPSLMVLGAIGFSFVMVALDVAVGGAWLDDVPWLYANQPDGARSLLSTIAGSMITVAGVTFSITVVAIVYASSQFGPRLLNNFMQDRGNQVTLGTFIATFLYCLLILRTVRSADEAAPQGAEAVETVGSFVPHLSILVALVLTLCSTGVLIYFIHHVPRSIHVATVVAGVGKELLRKIDHLFPAPIGEADDEHLPDEGEIRLPEGFMDNARAVPADGNGYIQQLDGEGLMELAVERDLVLCLSYRPGDFVTEGKALAWAWPAARVDEESAERITRAFVWGRQRTPVQDIMLLINELVEIAARALSPGVNDPFTAINCMDWLGSALGRLTTRALPASYRFDEAGRLRIVASSITFEIFAGACFDQVRPYVSTDRNAALHQMKVFAELAAAARTAAQRAVLQSHATALRDGFALHVGHPEDLAALERRYRTVLHLLQDPNAERALAEASRWLEGSA